MERFAAFENSTLQARLERLQRTELDLQERISTRIEQAEAEGRWILSDPLYQRLSSVMRQVRAELRQAEHEHLRRARTTASRELAA
jgi:hypothetical protein